MDSPQFTALVAKAEMEARDLVFLVGGADGLPAAWRVRADLLLSLSRLTLPHELARAVLTEQIYRAFATLRGHPYPREGRWVHVLVQAGNRRRRKAAEAG